MLGAVFTIRRWKRFAAVRRATIILDPNGNHHDSFHRATLRRVIETEIYKKRPAYVIDANSAWCTGIKLLGSGAVPSVDADNGIEAFQRLRGDDEFGPTLRRALHGSLAALAELGWTLAEADLLLDPFDTHDIRAWAGQRPLCQAGTRAAPYSRAARGCAPTFRSKHRPSRARVLHRLAFRMSAKLVSIVNTN